MTQPVHLSLMEQASAWATSLWDQAAHRWTDRTGQDISYRTHAVNPVVFDLIAAETGSGPCNLLDLGCGDGTMLADDHMAPLIEGSAYLGVDTCRESLARARERNCYDGCSFLGMDLTDPALPDAIHRTGTKWRCIIVVFVVQEIADITAFFANLSQIMTPESFAVLVTVHPAFADWLREEGALAVNHHLDWHGEGTPLWQWAGGYPIVDEPHEPFPLPHFQRTLDEYRRLLEQAGLRIDRLVEFPETAKQRMKLHEARISPFYAFPTNVYWPRIGEAPSSAALVVRKGSGR